jgi:ERF superfamily
MSETSVKAPTPNLNKALSLLQGELPRIPKTKEGKIEGETKTGKYFSYTYSYADLGDVVADVGPLLAKHGLAFHCAPTIDPANRTLMILAWSLLHESGEERSGEWPLGPVNQKPQTLGSMITYGRRYSFTAATNIVLEDDDDGQQAQRDHGSRQSAGDAWDSATPARPVNQVPRQEAANGNGHRSHPAPDLGDWDTLVDAISSPEDGDQAQTEIDEAFTDGRLDPAKAAAIRRAVKAKVASLGDSQQGDDHAAVQAFRASLKGLDGAQLGAKRAEVGRLIADRKITPATGAVLSGEIARLRRELSEAQA